MSRTSRRNFAKTLTAAGAALPLATADLVAQTPAAPLATALTQVVRAEYGSFLTGEEMERIGKDMREYVPLLERLRAVKLVNADEPDFP